MIICRFAKLLLATEEEEEEGIMIVVFEGDILIRRGYESEMPCCTLLFVDDQFEIRGRGRGRAVDVMPKFIHM